MTKGLPVSVLVLALCACSGGWKTAPGTNVYGTVTSDGKPVEGVLVSDGYSFARTDGLGRYELAGCKKQQTVFVVTPGDYTAVSGDGLTPGFWKMTSSDSTLVERCDFELRKTPGDSYGVIFLPDAHLCGAKNALALFDSLTVTAYGRAVDSLSCVDRVVSVNLGDISHDRYWYESDFSLRDACREFASAGIRYPMYSVTGNHDHDPSVCVPDAEKEDFLAQRQYRELLGPAWYSVNISTDHWIFMDNMEYVNTPLPEPPYKGVAGKRNYNVGYSSAQLQWLEKDMDYVKPGTRVCICSHGPLFDVLGLCHPESQVAFIDSLAAVHGVTVDFFAGHVHRMDTALESRYPHIRVFALPALSGNMWESSPQCRPLGLDGCEGGIEYASFEAGKMTRRYITYSGENPCFRVYDMDELARCWRSGDERYAWIINEIDGFVDYTDPSYRGCLLVNCWWMYSGCRLEVSADNVPLTVRKAPFGVDPIALESHFNFRRGIYEGKHKCPGDIELSMAKLFMVKPPVGCHTIEVRLLDENGIEISSSLVERVGNSADYSCGK